MPEITVSLDIQYFILITALLILPKVLLRFGVPTGISSLALGTITALSLGWFAEGQVIPILSTLGITSLFLFAGLEVDFSELKEDSNVLIRHLLKAFVFILLSTMLIYFGFGFDMQTSIVLTLALTTPSTGFILNSINAYNFEATQKHWIKSKAISHEIIALIILFFAIKSDSLVNLGTSLLALIGLIVTLPIIFKYFLKVIAPFSPDSEATFMILIALLAGVATKAIGTYYLVGAFIAGVVAAQFRHFVSTENSEKMLYAVSFFASLFIPFYFYKGGLSLGSSELTWNGAIYGLLFFAIFVPLRYLSVILSIRWFLPECWDGRKEISISLMPTLIFGLVISTILKDRFGVSDDIVFGIVLYSILTSILPAIRFKKAPPDVYDTALVKYQ
ncbi:MAG: cation:proton antiporter [Bdellovibrionales bacterium]